MITQASHTNRAEFRRLFHLSISYSVYSEDDDDDEEREEGKVEEATSVVVFNDDNDDSEDAFVEDKEVAGRVPCGRYIMMLTAMAKPVGIAQRSGESIRINLSLG